MSKKWRYGLIALLVAAGCVAAALVLRSVATARTPIRFALVCPKSGSARQYGEQFVRAADMAVEGINQAGGINGRLLEYDLFDSENSALRSTEIAAQVCEEDYLFTLGDYSSSCCMAAAPVYENARMVQFTPIASNIKFCQMGDYQFSLGAYQLESASFYADEIVRRYLGAETAAVVYLNNEWGNLFWETFENRAVEIGLTVAACEPIAVGESDFTDILARISQTNPDCIILMTNYVEAKACLSQVQSLELDTELVLVSSALTEEVLLELEMYGNGIVSAIALEGENEQQQAFQQHYQERYGGQADWFAIQVYDAVCLSAQALKDCGGNVTRERFRHSLADIEGHDGIIGKIDFDETGAFTSKEYPPIVRLVDGVWVEVR